MLFTWGLKCICVNGDWVKLQWHLRPLRASHPRPFAMERSSHCEGNPDLRRQAGRLLAGRLPACLLVPTPAPGTAFQPLVLDCYHPYFRITAVWTVSGGRPLPIILPGSASMWLLKSFIQVYLDNCIVLGFCWICKLKRLYKVFRILGIISHFIVRWILSCVWLEDPWKRHSLHLLQFIFVYTQ